MCFALCRNCAFCNDRPVAVAGTPQELALCSFHPEPPIFTVGRSTGRYPCCGGHAARSGAMQLFSAGCCAREHQVLPTSSAPPVTASLAAAGTSKAGAVGNLPERMAGDWATLHAFRHLIVPEPAAWNMIELRSDGSEEEEDGEEGEEEGAGPGPLSAAARRQGQQGRSHSARAQGSRDSAAGQFSMYKQQSRVTQSARSPSKQAAGSTGGGGGVGDARSRPSPTRSGAHNQAAGAARRQLSGSFSASGRFEGLDNSADSRHGGAALEAASAVASLDAGGGSSSTSGAGALSAIAPRLGGLSGASASVQQAWLAGVEGQQSPRGQQQPVQPVKVVPLSALGSVAGGGGYSPSHGFGGPGSHVSRKLRLELLHEDDVSVTQMLGFACGPLHSIKYLVSPETVLRPRNVCLRSMSAEPACSACLAATACPTPPPPNIATRTPTHAHSCVPHLMPRNHSRTPPCLCPSLHHMHR